MIKALSILKIAYGIAKNYKEIVPEFQELYRGYHDARKDGKVTLRETQLLLEDFFDLLALLIPAFNDFKAMFVSVPSGKKTK